ncbi:MAG: 4Fe-4S binding protein [Candidatus Woesearchaeota archaeon]
MTKNDPGWRDLEDGGKILDAGNSEKYKTGDWRTFRPIWDEKKCTHCLICWINCPDSCILVKDTKMQTINLEQCKGCGICAEVCPVKCIIMKDENEFKK